MTTIAYKEGIIAYDSFLTNSDMIVSTNFEKKISFKERNIFFFMSGIESEHRLFVEYYLSGRTSHEFINCSAIVFDVNRLFRVFVAGNNMISKNNIYPDMKVAIGSGSHFALGAMNAGASAKEAVKIASDLDLFTGGRIKTFDVYKQMNIKTKLSA